MRDTNEDSVWCGDRLVAVADGMGGHAAGEVASRMAIRVVSERREPDRRAPVEEAERAVERAIAAANREVYRSARSDPKLSGMGTTLTVALFVDGFVVIGHVGDSRAYLIRTGAIRQLTRDHSVVWELVRSGGISEREASRHPYRNLLTRALGTGRELEVDTLSHALIPGDAVLLCSDGLTGTVKDEEILSAFEAAEDPQVVVDSLIDAANARGGPDNVSAILALPEVRTR